MMQQLFKTTRQVGAFLRDERGVASVEIVLIFPVFMIFFLMIYENGIIGVRHVMLERGVDLAVREVRIGRLREPTSQELKARICAGALIIPNCETQLELEMVTRDPRNWVDIPAEVKCVDRGAVAQPVQTFTNGGNNQLQFLRACARFDPVMPTTGIGKAIVDNNSDSASGGSYALVATSAFVVEPFNRATTSTVSP